jgi:hypothetical protein
MYTIKKTNIGWRVSNGKTSATMQSRRQAKRFKKFVQSLNKKQSHV